MITGLVLLTLCGLLISLSPHFIMYVIFRSITAFLYIGTQTLSILYASEFVNPSYKDVVAIIYSVITSLFFLLDVLFAWLLQNWRYLHVAMTFPSLLIVMYYFLPESPKWLITQNRVKEAENIFKKIAHINGHQIQSIDKDEVLLLNATTSANSNEAQQREITKENGIWITVFGNARIRRCLVFLFLHWNFVCGIFYGTIYGNITLPGDIYINGVCTNGVAILVAPVGLMLFRKVTFKRGMLCLAVFQFVGLTSIAILLILYNEFVLSFEVAKWSVMLLGLLNQGCAGLCLSAMLSYACYIFPTKCSAFCLAICSTGGRSMIVVVPYILLMSSQLWRPGPYVMFALVALCDVIVVLFLPSNSVSPNKTDNKDLDNRKQ